MANSQGGLKMMTILLFISIINLIVNIGILTTMVIIIFREAVE